MTSEQNAPDPQEEGNSDRLYLGIDGTMGDAQDVDHPFIGSVHGDYCRVCGLAKAYRRHTNTVPLESHGGWSDA